MKTGFLPVAMLDTPGAGAEDATSADKQPSAGAFDAVLAAVAAQVATMGTATKPAQPAVPVPSQSLLAGDAAKDSTNGSTAKGPSNAASNNGGWLAGASSIQRASLATGPVDVVPGVPFNQLVVTQVEQNAGKAPPGAAVAPQEGPPATVAKALPAQQVPVLAQTSDAQPTVQPPVASQVGPKARQNPPKNLAPQAAGPSAVAVPEPLPGASVSSPVAPQTQSALLSADSGASAPTDDDNDAPQATVQDPTLQADARLLSQRNQGLALPVQGAPSVMNAQTTTDSKQSSAVASGRARAAAESRVETPLLDDVAAGFSMPALTLQVAVDTRAPQVVQDRAAQQLAAAQVNVTLQPSLVAPQPGVVAQEATTSLPVPQQALPVVQAAAAALPTATVQPIEAPPEANLRVEFVELPPLETGNESAPVELSPHELADELDASAEPREHTSDAQTQSDAQPQNSADPRAAIPAPFESTEVQGARGLEQVVASLLRASSSQNGEPVQQRAPADRNVQNASVLANVAQPVQTQKSSGEKSAQLAVSVNQSLVEAANRREEELSLRRELGEPETSHLPMQHEAKAQFDAKLPEAAPVLLPTPAVLPDPDAAMMGKLSRGQGINAANISIEHPELGAMDLVVQSENGRVEVRATAETPKAAAVLRAHESALRYGIQQAGMTFGALKVRSRGAEGPEAVKTREASKQRRRNHEWEA